MSTDNMHPIQESIRIQLGLDPAEPTGPKEGWDSWLNEYEPHMFEDEDLEPLGEETLGEETLGALSKQAAKAVRESKTLATAIAHHAQEITELLRRSMASGAETGINEREAESMLKWLKKSYQHVKMVDQHLKRYQF